MNKYFSYTPNTITSGKVRPSYYFARRDDVRWLGSDHADAFKVLMGLWIIGCEKAARNTGMVLTNAETSIH